MSIAEILQTYHTIAVVGLSLQLVEAEPLGFKVHAGPRISESFP